jgi:hypothetical protein
MENKIKPIDFSSVSNFEKAIADFYGAKHGIAVDSCTHGIELCLRHFKIKAFDCPKHTYISIPFLADKLGIDLIWNNEKWLDYYRLTLGIIDAAVLWKKDSYIPRSYMCISFQYQKHLSLGRGGMILCDNDEVALELKKMSYDGRLPNIPWRDQDIDTMGYHYYMTPETAQLGLTKLPEAIKNAPRQWTTEDWPDLTKMKIFEKYAS